MDARGNVRLRFGDFEFDSASWKLFRGDCPVKIQPQPLRVLSVLLERAGEVVSREQLRTRIWDGATFVEFDQSLTYWIRQIRVALRYGASKPAKCGTRPNQAYSTLAAGAVPHGRTGAGGPGRCRVRRARHRGGGRDAGR